MEFLLLWADELDDVLAVLRHYAPRILGLIAALALFAATGFALILVPHAMLVAFAVVLSATLFETLRRRRARIASDPSE
ncbi:MAG TPA: hypothetical protein VJT10_19080 [Steroidobacteraceae bacterium]|jgi:hypothetical protein|nr:hypothetical protein [Steroidobacteraceae bacterium]